MQEPTVLHFIRHGNVHNPGYIFYGRLPGYGLSEQGRQEARNLARLLRDVALAAVFSSPLERARQTAAALLPGRPHQRLQVSDLLTEVHTCYEGGPAEEVDRRRGDIYTGTGPPFEQPRDIVARVLLFIEEVRSTYAGRQIAVVTHGDIILFLIIWAAGMPVSPQNKLRLRAAGFPVDYPETGSVTCLTYAGPEAGERPAIRYQKPGQTAGGRRFAGP